MDFHGVIISDWNAIHDAAASVKAGCDTEMPHADYYSQTNLNNLLGSGDITLDELERMAFHGLYPMFRWGLIDHADLIGNLTNRAVSDDHKFAAHKIAMAGTIVLKNGKMLGAPKYLPYNEYTSDKIAVLGNAAHDFLYITGECCGGNVTAVPGDIVTPL